MPHFTFALRLLAPIPLCVAALHLVFGVSADVMLGASLSTQAIADPTLNSQNRFYGASYALYGVVLWLCAGDMRRFEPIFKAVMWVALCGGAARLVAWGVHGAPSPVVVFLLATELVFPVVLLVWYARVRGGV
jgi:hypothetical protein